MANYSRWTEVRGSRSTPSAETRTGIEQDLAPGQLIFDLGTEAGLSLRELAERMGTTQSVISRLEEDGGARNRIDTLARLATALIRHLIVSFPEGLRSWTELRRATPGRADTVSRHSSPSLSSTELGTAGVRHGPNKASGTTATPSVRR